MLRPSKFVSNTTTRSGTKKMRLMVSEFGRFGKSLGSFISEFVSHDIIGGCDEGDPARRRQGHEAASAHHSHAEAHRPNLRSAVLAVSARPHKESPGNRRS